MDMRFLREHNWAQASQPAGEPEADVDNAQVSRSTPQSFQGPESITHVWPLTPPEGRSKQDGKKEKETLKTALKVQRGNFTRIQSASMRII